MRYLFILILTTFPFFGFTQTGTGYGNFTRDGGSFVIANIPFGTYSNTASAIGYKSQTKQITLLEEKPEVNTAFSLPESVATLDEVVISRTMMEVSRLESPVPVEVYSPQCFKANPTPSIFESLLNVNGVRPQLNCNVCNTGDIHINGPEGPYTMILIDCMPIVSGLSTVYGLTGIPQALIKRMEIVHENDVADKCLSNRFTWYSAT